MFAVKSDYSIKTPNGKDIPFYVANSEIFLCHDDLKLAGVNTMYLHAKSAEEFDNFPSYFFISLTDFKDSTLRFAGNWGHSAFWRDIINQDYFKVIAEVSDAQKFAKKCFELGLPEEWSLLKVDWVINTLPGRTSAWIEKCYKSLQILATNDEQKRVARRVFDEAWKILKAREKAANADKRPAVHEVLAKVGLTDDDLIQAVLNVHETKFANEQSKRKADFDNQHIYLEAELRRILE